MADDRPRHSLNPNTQTGLSGWAIDPQNLSRAITLAVSVDGRAVASLSATRPRNGVKKLYGGDGRHGFVSVLPVELYDGAAKPMRVERTDTGEALFDGVADFADLRWSDTVSGLMRAGKRGLAGWAVDLSQPDETVVVEIWMDGRRLYDLPADQPSDALPWPEGPRRNHGFAVAWPAEALDGAEHRFEARLAGRDASAMATVTARPDPAMTLPWTGELTFQNGWLKGVLLADDAGSLAVPLAVMSGDTLVRWLWVRSGQRIMAWVFDEDAPRLAGPLHLELSGGVVPLDFGPDAAGRILTEWRLHPETGRVEGSAADLSDPQTPATVALMVDGEEAQTTTADHKGFFHFDLADAPIAAPFSEVRVRINGVEPVDAQAVRYSRGGPVCEVVEAVWRDFRLQVRGWALDFTAPDAPVTVSLLLDGAVVATAASDPQGEVPGAFAFSILTGPVDLATRAGLRIGDASATPLPDIRMEQGVPAPDRPEAQAQAEDEIVGVLERVGDATAHGWIANASNPEARPQAVLWLDDRPLALPAATLDVDAAETAPGACGYIFDLPPDLSGAERARLIVRPGIGRDRLSLAENRVAAGAQAVVCLDASIAPPPSVDEPALVLVLSREGAAAVEALLETAVRHETGAHQWVVLDARAEPEMEAVCERARALGLNVRRRITPAHLMGETARTVAAEADAATVVLIDDATRLIEPVLAALAGALTLRGVGLAGVTTRQPLGGGLLETAGRRIVAAANGGMRRPYGVAPSHAACPAWTALPSDGPVAMRREIFVDLGGMHDAIALHEQVADLALRLNSRLGLGVVTLPSCVELTSDPLPVKDRRAAAFRDRWAGALRDVLRDPEAVAAWTGARPMLGLLVEDDVNTAGIAAPVGWRIRRLPPTAWSDLSEIDAAVVLSPAFNPAAIVSARPHLRLIDGTAGVPQLSPTPGLRIAIKTPARKGQEAHWGDFHFANSLAEALTAQGHSVRVDVRNDWYGPLAATDDVVIVLRGLAAYHPNAHQTNLMWIISHPEAVPVSELAEYDHVFVASQPYAATLGALTDRPVEPLLQCTDPARFNPEVDTTGMPADELVFVGNARGVFRPAVQWAMQSGRGLALYGRGWDGLIPPDAVRTHYVPNEILASLYRAGGVVLCDHWDDMRRLGFISNRVFDAMAAGAVLATDAVEGLEAVFGEHAPPVIGSAADIVRVADKAADLRAKAQAASGWVLAHHTFADRARRIVEVAGAALARRPTLRTLGR